eukprot:7237103-Lingulodinium_polyedra.AAC.1
MVRREVHKCGDIAGCKAQVNGVGPVWLASKEELQAATVMQATIGIDSDREFVQTKVRVADNLSEFEEFPSDSGFQI